MKNKIKDIYNKNKNLIKSLFTITIFFLNNLFEFIPILLFKIDYSKLSNKNKILFSFYDYIILFIILIIIYRKDIIKYLKDLKKRFGFILDKGISYWIVGLIVMMISNILIMKFFPQASQNNEQNVQSIIKTLPALSFITVGIIGPIIEEFTFRKAFYDIFKNKDVFVFVSGFVFGLLHVLLSYTSLWDFLYVIPYSALGIAFALMYKKTENLAPSVLMHIIHNSLLTLVSIISLSL